MTATLEQYKRALQELLPPGRAFAQERGTTLSELLEAFAFEYDRISERVTDLLRENDPRSTHELLEAWERAFGLPSPCTGPLATIQERRAAVLARLSSIGGQSPAFFVQLAAVLGYEIRVLEFRAFRVGHSRVGDRLSNHQRTFRVGRSRVGERLRNNIGWLYTWAVIAPAVTVRRFAVGRSAVGERLAVWQNRLLECTLQSVAPAHTLLHFRYEVRVDAPTAPQLSARPLDFVGFDFLAPQWVDLMLPRTDIVPLVAEFATTADEYQLNPSATAPVELPTLFIAGDLFANGGMAEYTVAGTYVNQTGSPISVLLELFRDEDAAPFHTIALEGIPATTLPTGSGQFWLTFRIAFRSTSQVRVAYWAVFNASTTQAGTLASGHNPPWFKSDVGRLWTALDLLTDRRIRPRLRKTTSNAAVLNPTEFSGLGLVRSGSPVL